MLSLKIDNFLPVKNSYNETSTLFLNNMDNIMKFIQARQKLFQSNNHKLQDFESKCNSLTSTFKNYTSFNHENFESIAKTHQDFQDKLNKLEFHKDIQDIKLEDVEVQIQKLQHCLSIDDNNNDYNNNDNC